MKESQARRLFSGLIDEAVRKSPSGYKVVSRGMGGPLLRHLLAFARGRLTEELSRPLDVSRPFAHRGVRLDTLVRRLAAHTSAGGVAIISVRRKYLHWTWCTR